MIKPSLLVFMKLGSIQYFLEGLSKFLGPERGACWRRGLEGEFTVSQKLYIMTIIYAFSGCICPSILRCFISMFSILQYTPLLWEVSLYENEAKMVKILRAS